MKKKLMLLLGVMVFITVAGAIIINLVKPTTDADLIVKDKKIKIVATFYPIYLIGLNLADQLGDIEVKSLTKLNTGCLHDYQLTTEDMKLISDADVLVINGGGMEGFMQDIKDNYPKLEIIDASQGITRLKDDYESYGHEEASDENAVADKLTANKESDNKAVSEAGNSSIISNDNPHVWLDPQLYIRQIENVRDGLINYLGTSYTAAGADSDLLKQEINSNAQNYIAEISKLDSGLIDITKSMDDTSNGQESAQAVIFHDSFAYLANRAGLKIAFAVPLDSDTSLSAGDIAAIINTVKQKKIKYLFTEQQYSDSIAKQIAAETEAKVFIIDSVVTGDGAKDSYVKAMQGNLEVLKQAINK